LYKLNANSTANAESTFATFPEIKSEIISKANHLVPKSSKKRRKYLSNSALHWLQGQTFSVGFLEELRTSKFAFELSDLYQ